MRLFSAATMLLVSLLVLGCVQSLNEEQAGKVLEGIAGELVKMEGASADKKMDMVKEVCEKEGVKVESLAKYLEQTPAAEEKLAEFMAGKLNDDLVEKKKAFQAELDRIDAEAKESADEARTALEEKRQQLEIEAQKQLAQAEEAFKKKEKELQETIAALRTQQ